MDVVVSNNDTTYAKGEASSVRRLSELQSASQELEAMPRPFGTFWVMPKVQRRGKKRY